MLSSNNSDPFFITACVTDCSGEMEFNMKVGIITIHNAINYGSALQAYALRQVIENMGCDCYIVEL